MTCGDTINISNMETQKLITIYRDADTGLLFYQRSWDNAVFPLPLAQNDVLKIHEDFTHYNNLLPEYEIIPLQTTDGIPTFIFRVRSQKIYAGGGGGGGIKGITVQDEGVQVNGTMKILNFTGDGVTVTDGGGGKGNINIPGFVIPAITEAQRLALTPTVPTLVEDITNQNLYVWLTSINDWKPL